MPETPTVDDAKSSELSEAEKLKAQIAEESQLSEADRLRKQVAEAQAKKDEENELAELRAKLAELRGEKPAPVQQATACCRRATANQPQRRALWRWRDRA